MSQQSLISYLRGWRGPEAASLDEYLEKAGQQAWNQLCDTARSSPGQFDGEVVSWLVANAVRSPGSVVASLLQVARQDFGRRAALSEAAREVIARNAGQGLGAAGYHLHECHPVIDDQWLSVARAWFDADPEGAWGIVEAAAMYEPEFLLPVHVDWFEAKRAAAPVDYFVTMLSLAGHRPAEASHLLERVLRHFDEHPAAAVEGASRAARDTAPLLVPRLIDAVLRHMSANAEKGWEFFDGAARARPDAFDDALLDRLDAAAKEEAGTLFSILRRIMDAHVVRLPRIMDRYVALLRRHPEKGIDAVRYAFQRDEIRLIRPDLVRAVCEGFAANARGAFELLHRCLLDRPELIGRTEVDAAIQNISHDTTADFHFFRELLKMRPEFTPEGTLALFEVIAATPARHGHARAEEIASVMAISEAAHIRTGLENALREPPRVGKRRARALMAIMFRQKLRARRHVLLEALRYAGGIVLWRKIPPASPGGKEESEKFSPVWDFVMFIIDNSGDDAISTAAAERFLEGAFQLSYLCRTGAEHDQFLRRLDTGYPPTHPFPAVAGFLDADPEISRLFSIVIELGSHFRVQPRIAPLDGFASRLQDAEIELRAIDDMLEKAEKGRREKLLERQKTLNKQVAIWINPAYAVALSDPEAEKRLSGPAQALLRREKKDLVKHLRDALRAEAIRIAVASVEKSRLELYQNRLREVLGHDVDIATVEPRILPSFLWFQAIGGMPKNTKCLKRLIEDRIAGRGHEWLRTEPAVLEWAEKVKKGQPGAMVDRWRAAFTKEYQYRPKDALAEKKRRIKADLSQARQILERAGAKGIAAETYDELAGKLAELQAPGKKGKEEEKEEEKEKPDPALLQEAEMNLERVRLAEQTPDSDFEGRITLSVETDPFEILFMGEYGFASCLALRGSNAWSAVSNAVDIDKVIIWAKEPGGNVVGRRLIVLTPGGLLTFRTYTNRHGLALDRAFEEFVTEYAAHCGVGVTHNGNPGPLLSDRWYDDGAI
ncbi:MAG: hypothetical protein FD180_286 [Planctomycetota bacterium]|nr:MAG: hypothetical protein FD180_286 [Planctomycetota bacterium]